VVSLSARFPGVLWSNTVVMSSIQTIPIVDRAIGRPRTTGAMTRAGTMELMVVEHDADRVRELVACGLSTFLVDWEHLGKDARQRGFDTEIRPATLEDLRRVSGVPDAVAWCRLNRFGPHTASEVEAAIGTGAHGLFLPMVTRPAEVQSFLGLVGGRAGVGILIETVEGLASVRQLASFPLDRVYFGLNDFAISRGGGPIFRAVLDGSVARAREAFAGTRFGFGGLSAVDGGYPVPCHRLLEEMARLQCDFCFLRRSFRRDLASRPAGAIVAGLETAWRGCLSRDSAAIERDHAALCGILCGLA